MFALTLLVGLADVGCDGGGDPGEARIATAAGGGAAASTGLGGTPTLAENSPFGQDLVAETNSPSPPAPTACAGLLGEFTTRVVVPGSVELGFEPLDAAAFVSKLPTAAGRTPTLLVTSERTMLEALGDVAGQLHQMRGADEVVVELPGASAVVLEVEFEAPRGAAGLGVDFFALARQVLLSPLRWSEGQGGWSGPSGTMNPADIQPPGERALNVNEGWVYGNLERQWGTLSEEVRATRRVVVRGRRNATVTQVRDVLLELERVAPGRATVECRKWTLSFAQDRPLGGVGINQDPP